MNVHALGEREAARARAVRGPMVAPAGAVWPRGKFASLTIQGREEFKENLIIYTVITIIIAGLYRVKLRFGG